MGRPRLQNRDRYVSGRPKPSKHGHGDITPTAVRRMLDRAKADASNPMLGSRLGQLALAGEVSAVAFSAGQHFASLVADYDQAKGLPPRGSVRSPSLEAGSKGEPAGGNPKTVERITKAYDAALKAMLPSERSAVVGLVVHDAELGWEAKRAAIAGLEKLTEHFHLRGKAA